MKKVIVIALSLMFIIVYMSVNVFAQNQFLDLIIQANSSIKEGKYTEGMDKYLQVYDMNKRHSELLKIISTTYLNHKEYEKSIEFANKVIELDSGFTKLAFQNKASAFEKLERYDSAIVAYSELIKRFGNDHRWRCDMADNYLQLGELTKAEEILTTLVREKPSYPKTHLILSQVKVAQGENVPGFLSLYFYLLLDPNQKRAKIAFDDLKRTYSRRIQQTRNGNINIFLDANSMQSGFGAIDIKLTFDFLLQKNGIDIRKDHDSLIVNDVKSTFILLGEAKKDTCTGLWWEYYIPFFYGIAKSDMIQAFANIIYASTYPSASKWIDENPAKVESFITNVREKIK